MPLSVTLPPKQKTWKISTNNRVPYVSIVDAWGNIAYGWKQFLIANGYTVRGSSDGISAAMDGVDRWISPSAASAVRGGSSPDPQCWMCLRDGNGCDILLCYEGTQAQVARFTVSPQGLYVLAGTPTFKPTATDEIEPFAGSFAFLTGTTSYDRIWFGWVDSQAKCFRMATARNGVFEAFIWGVELVSSAVVSGTQTATWSPPVWAFAPQATAAYVDSPSGPVGIASCVLSGVRRTPAAFFGWEYGANGSIQGAVLGNKCPLHGNIGYPILPLSIGSNTASATGKLGDLIDSWGIWGSGNGELWGNKNYIGVGGLRGTSGSWLWPWDGQTIPSLT